MVHWTEMRKELRAAIGEFAGLQPDVMQGIDKMQNAAVATGHLDAKTHELIALAVAVTGAALVYSSRALDAFDNLPK